MSNNHQAGFPSQQAALEAQRQQMPRFDFTCCYCDKVFLDLHALDRHHYEHYQGQIRSDEALKLFEASLTRNQNERRRFLGAHLSLAPPASSLQPDHHQVPTGNVNVNPREPAVVIQDHATPMVVEMSTNNKGKRPLMDELDKPMEAPIQEGRGAKLMRWMPTPMDAETSTNNEGTKPAVDQHDIPMEASIQEGRGAKLIRWMLTPP